MNIEENELLTRVGPGTPIGTLMRQYWIPALLSAEISEPDCDPVRVMLLGEQFIAFRDTAGTAGLLANRCPHRGASLFFGRNEKGGLRCVYHGWKFDACGTCVDMPNEPPMSKFKLHVKAISYPCVERGGVVWTYMGDRELPPPLPNIEGNQLGDDGVAWAVMRSCNWLQALEGDIDTSHQGFLHHGAMTPEEAKPDSFQYFISKDRAPRYVSTDTDYGELYGAYRPAEPGETYWRLAEFLFPFYTNPPQGVLGRFIFNRAWVPMDDKHTMVFTMEQASHRAEAFATQPNGTGWFDRFRLVANEGNDYLIDRETQRRASYALDGTTSWTGITGIMVQDQAVTESMGAVSDRTTEHLGSADMMAATVRKKLRDAALDLANDGVIPPGVDDPDVYSVRAGGVILPADADWLEATKDLRAAYVEHPEVDPIAVRGF